MSELSLDWPQRYRQWLHSSREWLDQKNWSEAFRTYPRPTFTSAPFTPLVEPLHRIRLALITSGGLSLPGQPLFEEDNPEGDASFRTIEGAGPLDDWTIRHGHYDPKDAQADYNSVFPLDVLRELVHQGRVGSLTARHLSFMGYQTDAARLLDHTAPEMADILIADGAQAALLVPV